HFDARAADAFVEPFRTVAVDLDDVGEAGRQAALQRLHGVVIAESVREREADADGAAAVRDRCETLDARLRKCGKDDERKERGDTLLSAYVRRRAARFARLGGRGRPLLLSGLCGMSVFTACAT